MTNEQIRETIKQTHESIKEIQKEMLISDNDERSLVLLHTLKWLTKKLKQVNRLESEGDKVDEWTNKRNISKNGTRIRRRNRSKNKKQC